MVCYSKNRLTCKKSSFRVLVLEIMCRICWLSLPLITSLATKNAFTIQGVPATSATLNTLSPMWLIIFFSESLSLRGNMLCPRLFIRPYITTAIIVAGIKATKNNPQSGSTEVVSQIISAHKPANMIAPTAAPVPINFWKYTPVIARTA